MVMSVMKGIYCTVLIETRTADQLIFALLCKLMRQHQDAVLFGSGEAKNIDLLIYCIRC